MRVKLLTGLTVIVALLVASAPVFAQAPQASFGSIFDGRREIVLTGVLAQVDWTEPSVAIYVNVKDEGGFKTYVFASESPTTLHQAGVRKRDFKVGETVTITAAPAKDKTADYLGWLEMIKYQDGHVLVFRNGSE